MSDDIRGTGDMEGNARGPSVIYSPAKRRLSLSKLNYVAAYETTLHSG